MNAKGKGRDSALAYRQLEAQSGGLLDGGSAQAHRLQKRRPAAPGNSPAVPAHYEYKDGVWVYSEDWSLNGQQGPAGQPPSSSGSGDAEMQQNTSADDAEQGDEENSGYLATEEAAPLTSLGWARTSNNVLGVDIVTELAADPTSTSVTASLITTPTTIRTASTSLTGLAAERPNLGTLSSSTSSSASIVAATASSRSTSSGGSGQTYDFRRDVPDGWLSDGRTAAYAVPVIVGLSIFLSCLIFSLLVIFVRATTSRRARRKQQAKLQEEGRLKKLDLPDEDGNFHRPRSQSPLNVQRGLTEFDEKAAAAKKKPRIGRRWAPAQNGALRRRKKDIARLFNRNSHVPETVVEVIDGPQAPHQQQRDGSDAHNSARVAAAEVDGSSARNGSETLDDTGSAPTRAGLPIRRTASHSSRPSEVTHSGIAVVDEHHGDDNDNDDHDRETISGSPTPSNATTAGDARRSPRPPSIRIDPPSLAVADSPVHHAATLTPASAAADADSHAVPLPAVGPPAYIHPPSPAYSRAANATAQTNDSYLTSRPPTASSASRYPASAASTPGLPVDIDEKRLLLEHQARAEALPAAAGTSSSAGETDPYSQQRRYEHLYASREGDDAADEQRTGAPQASMARAATTAAPSHMSMTGHIAVDDKDLLARMRAARSAPDAALSPASLGEANAPAFEHADSDEELAATQAAIASSAADATTVKASSASRLSGLPLPPRALQFASTPAAMCSTSPALDEKARLRVHEEAHASMFVGDASHLFAFDAAATAAQQPSAPPVTAGRTANAPSAPPMLDGSDEQATEASAPTFILADQEEQEQDINQDINQDNRLFREGTL